MPEYLVFPYFYSPIICFTKVDCIPSSRFLHFIVGFWGMSWHTNLAWNVSHNIFHNIALILVYSALFCKFIWSPLCFFCITAAKMTQFWARFKQNRAQNPAIREILAKYYRIAPQNCAELAPSLFQNYYYEFPYTWIFLYWFLYVVCLWASLLHWHICWALKY